MGDTARIDDIDAMSEAAREAGADGFCRRCRPATRLYWPRSSRAGADLHQHDVYPGPAFAVPALIAIAADPRTADRTKLATWLGFLAADVLDHDTPAAAGVR